MRVDLQNIGGFPDMGPPSKVCNKRGCGKSPVKWQVGLTLHCPKRYGRHPVEGQVTVYLCSECGPLATVEDVVSDEAWRLIIQSFRAKLLVEPDRRLTEIRLLPVLDL